MLDFGGFWRWFAHLFETWPPGVPPDPKKCENVSIFVPKTMIFHIKKASIPFCFSNIFGKKTNDTVHKNRRNAIFEAKNASISFCFFANLGKNTAGTVHKKKGQHSVLFFKHLWGEFFERTCTMLRNQSKSYVLLLTRSPYSIAVPYSRGGRSEAQQNFLL